MSDSSDPGAMAPFDAIPEPPPAESAGGSGGDTNGASKKRRFAFQWNSPGTLLVLVLVLGFGQSLALLVFFGGRGDDLSASHGAPVEGRSNAQAPAAEGDVHAADANPGAGEAQPHQDDHGSSEPPSASGATPHAGGSTESTSVKTGAGAHDAADSSDAHQPTEPPPAPTRTPDVLDTARDMLDRGDVSGARRIATAYLLRLDGMNAAARDRASAAYAILGDAMRLDYELSLRLRGDGP